MSIEAGVTATLPSASAIILTATTGCHLLKISGYSHARMVGNGDRVESAKFKAAGHTWRILFCPKSKYSTDHDAFALYLKLADRSKGIDAEVQFSLLPRHGVEHGTLSYSKPKIAHTFVSTRRSNKCGFNWFIGGNEIETLQNKYVWEDDDSIVVRCDIKVMNKLAIRSLRLEELPVICRCDDGTCKRLHDRSLAVSDIAVERQSCLGIKGQFRRLLSCFIA